MINNDLINNLDVYNMKIIKGEKGTIVLKDKETDAYHLQSHMYLLINAHPYAYNIYIVNGFNLNIDVWFGNDKDYTFDKDTAKKTLTITSTGNSRGYLIDTGLISR